MPLKTCDPKYFHWSPFNGSLHSLTNAQRRALDAFQKDLCKREYDVPEGAFIAITILKLVHHTHSRGGGTYYPASYGAAVEVGMWSREGHYKRIESFPRQLTLKEIRELRK